MRRGFWGAVCLLLPMIVLAPASVWAESRYRIIETEAAETVGENVLRIDVEVGARNQGDGSHLYNLPRARATYGISDWVDIEYEYELLKLDDGTVVDFSGGPSRTANEYGSGDLRVKLKLVPYETEWGNIGFTFETKGPNANNSRGLGTDGADFAAHALWSLDWSLLTDDPFWSKFTTHKNIGFAVQSNPRANGTHSDFVLWGVAVEYPLTETLTLAGEFEGAVWHDGGPIDNPTVQFGTESSPSTMARLALTGQMPFGEGWEWGVSGGANLSSRGQDWEVQVGVSKVLSLSRERRQARSTSPEMRYTDPEALFTYYNPMWTEAAYAMGHRRIRGEVEFGYVNQVDGSDLWIVPQKTAWIGLSDWAEIGFSFQYLSVDNTTVERGGTTIVADSSATGPGDVRMHVRLVPFRTRIGDLGMLVTTKIPSASGSIGLGTGEVDVMMRGMLSTNWGAVSSTSFVSKLTTHVNLGVALVDDPFTLASQSDVWVWGVLAEYAATDDFTVWWEVHGGAAGGTTTDNIAEGEFGEKQVTSRMGITGPLPLPGNGDWRWSFTAGAGLTENTADWNTLIGISRTWDIDG